MEGSRSLEGNRDLEKYGQPQGLLRKLVRPSKS